MDLRFEQFLREKRYLQNVSQNTLNWCSTSYIAYKKVCGIEFSKPKFTEFIIALREQGLTPGGGDNDIRGLNIFSSWLHETGTLQRGCNWCHCPRWDRATKEKVLKIRSVCVLCACKIVIDRVLSETGGLLRYMAVL